ncbi:hypothetical protein MLD38_026322 [Melastoma candidum]|uniref:Uncharacterized protein n=1 Tax=Melastoma candidum TaxID=119954 RepID=A0ACB9NY08_9MYRT|nr:hypothetical protein MLD38_026322 [Melastoma candidum]
MITPHHRRARSLDKQFPRCLGKMVNLFDLSAGLTSNKLLTDRLIIPMVRLYRGACQICQWPRVHPRRI